MNGHQKRPLVLAILDGWGERTATHGNAIAAATLPNWHRILRESTHTLLDASGEAVGLPKGIMGNSEVGHTNIGSGRVVPQGLVVIDDEIADGSFAKNPALVQCIAHVRQTGGTIHFLGLVSDGRVHSSQRHLEALVDAAAQARVPFVVDAFLDGRDTAPRSAERYLAELQAYLEKRERPDAIATISGRYYAMDRDKRWERIERAYVALVRAQADHHAADAASAIRDAYARDESDEFVVPTIIGEPRPIRDGDAAIFFNFRPDRARELTLALTDPSFDHFATRTFADFLFATMTKYEENFTGPVLFGPRPQHETFGEIVARAGLRQLRLAETEKYAHVTYFFNGGREEVFDHEDRVLVPSNRVVATYDLAPEMSAEGITEAALADLAAKQHDFIVLNYANADMVGHTGKWEATIAGCETIDGALGRLEAAVRRAGGILAITADHGNAEEKIDDDGNALTAHTTNPVPFVLVADEPLGTLAEGGKLGDIAPTLLPLLGLHAAQEMTGSDLLKVRG